MWKTLLVLHLHILLIGIDTYGTGRSPFFLEPSVIIIITDGGKLSSQQGVQDDVSILICIKKSNKTCS